ncbi:Cbb3-type cytochrome oxidase component FixQ [Flavobacterium cutihirudinis]|uniref:Cbb3-type cytochrome oxidase component FixQ n=1 Tax=Flavobacterium cutihirudinis TaxID=1265740 RepID=A0A3D9G2J0_9FLAO|nr:cbb3-type cytochrome c oxidase subunit 3 [Flavobacterium cutihirudinis]RED26797.1 Cbb3-type cytochrome oxidase component FixQ [Flavobacterium cutihirudinis]
MKIFRKISGCILIVLASIFSFSTVLALAKAILVDCVREINNNTAQGIGYLFGTLIMGTLFVLLIIYMFKSGFRLVRTKPVVQDSIDDIGVL